VTYGADEWTDHRTDQHYGDGRDEDPWLPIRIEVGYRVRDMNQNHIKHATFDRPDNRLPGPHALGWLYATATEQDQIRPFQIDVASRMFPWTDDDRPAHNVKDAAVLVAQMATIAEDNLRTHRADPVQFTDRTEPLPYAQFIGIAISSLGVEGMDWGSMKASAFGFGVELPSSCVVRMVDGTWLELSRTGRGGWRSECNRAMGYMNAMDWNWRSSMPPNWTPRPGSMHDYLDRLVAITDRTYEERRHQQPAPRQRGAYR